MRRFFCLFFFLHFFSNSLIAGDFVPIDQQMKTLSDYYNESRKVHQRQQMLEMQRMQIENEKRLIELEAKRQNFERQKQIESQEATKTLLDAFSRNVEKINNPYSDAFNKVAGSIVIINTFDKLGKNLAQGSGVCVGENIYITNRHVLKDSFSIEVAQGNVKKNGNVVGVDLRHDIGVVSVNEQVGMPLLSDQIKSLSEVKTGDSVFAVGAPQGLEMTISNGIVSGTRSDGFAPFIQTTAAISKGSSGGGLFSLDGRLIGITSFFIKQGQGLNFAIPTETALKALVDIMKKSESR